MDFAYVDKLAKENNGGKFLLVRQDFFDRTVNAEEKITKDSQATVKTFSTIYTETNRTKNIWLTREPRLLDGLKILCCWGDTSLLYYDRDWGGFCRMYNAIVEK